MTAPSRRCHAAPTPPHRCRVGARATTDPASSGTPPPPFPPQVTTEAIRALCNLARSESNTAALIADGGVEAITLLLQGQVKGADSLPSECDSLPSECDSLPSECDSLPSECDRRDPISDEVLNAPHRAAPRPVQVAELTVHPLNSSPSCTAPHLIRGAAPRRAQVAELHGLALVALMNLCQVPANCAAIAAAGVMQARRSHARRPPPRDGRRRVAPSPHPIPSSCASPPPLTFHEN
jgi:hypothetical protein